MSFKTALATLVTISALAVTPSFAATVAAVVQPGSGGSILATERFVSLPTPRPEAAALPTLSNAPSPRLGVFHSVAISAARLPAAAKWQTIRAEDHTALFDTDCSTSGVRGCDTSFARKVQGVAARAAGLSDRAMLDLVNRTVNGAMRYREDSIVWGKGDYWATPSEMALKGAGDCEDFAIAKYWLLRSLGIADEQLQIVVLQDTRRRLFHAVLVVHTASGAYVLDNVSNRLEADSAYSQYQPIMSFAAGKNYIHGFTGGASNVAAMPRDLANVAPGSGL
ncbi:Predicted transglutaminase-like cysteine proteinase [Devosia lucknowensis]|uniref:Predicted transglutaminase-like cysteine proteinase n=1 Tax=Devosia lucknowensis TaxID=1096929 RepID=A0A1Y6ED41_9HYPH|nr:transglutaminase-like cysteine peptidase [Devosia lucknowensis]SMQ60386.1 Predicted transglutaminase-like cysteine proteinase [Devosia lucknowensis]